MKYQFRNVWWSNRTVQFVLEYGCMKSIKFDENNEKYWYYSDSFDVRFTWYIYTGVLVNWKFDLSVSSSVSMGFVFCWVYLSYDG